MDFTNSQDYASGGPPTTFLDYFCYYFNMLIFEPLKFIINIPGYIAVGFIFAAVYANDYFQKFMDWYNENSAIFDKYLIQPLQ